MSASTIGRRHHVVIVGCGFGGLFAAKPLRRAEVDVTVIDRATACEKGSCSPLGATPSDDGVNFSVFSKHATGVQLLLFDRVDVAAPCVYRAATVSPPGRQAPRRS